MNTIIINLLLWIPFALVFVTALILFLISGYRRGFWRGLISLGVTVVSAGLSLLLSKLIAAPLAGLVAGWIPAEGMNLPISGEFALNLVQGLVGVIISMILFSSLLLLCCIIGKTMSNYLGDEKLKAKNTGMKWAGLGIRLVDAVVFSLLLVLPFYGTLATYTPVVQTVITIQGEEAEEVQEYLNIIAENPVVSASSEGPAAWVYDGLSEAQVGDSTLDVANMADSMNGLYARIEELDTCPEEEQLEKTLELIDYLRTDVVDEAWCYELVIRQLLPEMKASAMKNEKTDGPWKEQFFALCDMSQKDFTTNARAILDFAEVVLENGMMEMDPEEVMKSQVFQEELGKMINTSRQSVGLKNLMIRGQVAEYLYDGNQKKGLTYSLRETPVEKALYKQDAKAFVVIMSAEDAATLLQGLAMLP